jgi:hypothetical protein
MNYGVFQEFYSSNWTLNGNQELTGIIGTTSNGVMYLSMPFLFALFTRRWARMRRIAALCGVALTCLSFFLSSFSSSAWHLVATQGVMSSLGCALVYSPTTLSLGEWFSNSHRAVAYGVVLSCNAENMDSHHSRFGDSGCALDSHSPLTLVDRQSQNTPNSVAVPQIPSFLYIQHRNCPPELWIWHSSDLSQHLCP